MKNVRNFWTELFVDGGRGSAVKTGPTRADGGFAQHIWMRVEDEPQKVLRIEGCVNKYGTLELTVTDKDGKVVFQHKSERTEKGQVLQ